MIDLALNSNLQLPLSPGVRMISHGSKPQPSNHMVGLSGWPAPTLSHLLSETILRFGVPSMSNKDTLITQEILRVLRLPLRNWGQRPAKLFVTVIFKRVPLTSPRTHCSSFHFPLSSSSMSHCSFLQRVLAFALTVSEMLFPSVLRLPPSWRFEFKPFSSYLSDAQLVSILFEALNEQLTGQNEPVELMFH